jgi:hypothetical protein
MPQQFRRERYVSSIKTSGRKYMYLTSGIDMGRWGSMGAEDFGRSQSPFCLGSMAEVLRVNHTSYYILQLHMVAGLMTTYSTSEDRLRKGETEEGNGPCISGLLQCKCMEEYCKHVEAANATKQAKWVQFFLDRQLVD